MTHRVSKGDGPRCFDHTFVSRHFEVRHASAAGYHHEWRRPGLSDHSAMWTKLRVCGRRCRDGWRRRGGRRRHLQRVHGHRTAGRPAPDQDRRTKTDWARFLPRSTPTPPKSPVMDNLTVPARSTKPSNEDLGSQRPYPQARQLAEFAEVELNVMIRQCLNPASLHRHPTREAQPGRRPETESKPRSLAVHHGRRPYQGASIRRLMCDH